MSEAPFKANCVVCGLENDIRFSLRLEKVNGTWVINPVCDGCRGLLIREAKGEGKFIPFFGIEVSQTEAAKRNEQAKNHRRFVEKFGDRRDDKKKSFKANLLSIATTRH